MNRPLAIAALTAALFSNACSSPPEFERPLDFAGVERTIAWQAERAARGDVVGLSYGLLHDGRIVFEGGAGFADRELGRVADAHTVFRVGSISKLMTAIAVMQLEEQGKVDLDAPLTRYLPEFTLAPPLLPGDAEGWSLTDITLRRMLTHHSGLPGDHLRNFFSSESHDYHEFPALLADEHAAAPAGLLHAYSNVGFTLLGLVVERVSGVPFVEYLQRNVLDRAGMTSSSFDLSDELAVRLSRGYRGGERGRWIRIGAVPAGSLYSTVHDLLLFARMVLDGGMGPGGRVLRAETLERMLAVQNGGVELDGSFEIGLAFFRERVPGVGTTVGHDGGTAYMTSRLMISREHRLASVAIVNSIEGGAHPGATVVRALQLAVEALTGRVAPEPSALADWGDTIPEAEVAGLAGHYQTALGHLALEARGDRLRGRLFGVPIEFRPTERGNFGGQLQLLGFLPLRVGYFAIFEFAFVEAQGTTAVVAERDGTRMLIGTRIAPESPSSPWRERIGAYEMIDPTDDLVYDRIALSEHDGVLALALGGKMFPGELEFALHVVDDETAVLLGRGRNLGTVVRYRDGELRFSGFRARLRSD